MIADSIKHITLYRGMQPYLDTAIDFLLKTDLSTLPDGKTVIDGDHVFVNVMEADLREAEGATFEYHKKYADLQINITGGEYWECTLSGETAEEYSEERDCGLMTGTPTCTGLWAMEGLLSFSPWNTTSPVVSTETVPMYGKRSLKLKFPKIPHKLFIS